MSIEWNKFLDENYNLCLRIADWAIDFDDAPQAIFKRGEEIENPLEIVAIIRIIGDKRVSETQIFEEWDELLTAVRNINDSFAVAVAACIESDYIFLITAESIFSKKEDV